MLGKMVIKLIRVYQRYAPTSMRASCRFAPTCSEYTIQAIEKKGALVGSVAGIKRIIRCRPPNGGEDLP